MNRRLGTFTFLLAILTLLLTACGGADQPAATPPATTTAQETTADDQPTLAADPTTDQPPTTTDQPPTANLTATLDATINPNRFPARGPVIIAFDRAVNAFTVSRPLSFEPPIEGEFAWNDDSTVVTFTPTGPFAVGESYAVGIHERLRGRDGATFAAPPAWTLTIAESPRVSRRPAATTGDATLPEWTLAFSQAMDRASVETALAAEPETMLGLSWSDDQTLAVRPAEPLTPGQTYTFTLSHTAAEPGGLTLADDFTFAYTPAPIVRGAAPGEDAPLVLTFARTMDEAGVVDALSVSPPIAGEWRWNETGDALHLLSDVPLPAEVDHAITFTEALRDAAGNVLPPGEPLVYRPPLPLIATPLGDNVAVFEPLRLAFDRPVDHDATAAALVIEPGGTDGKITWEGETLVYQPEDAFWRTLTTYKVRLETTALDAAGNPLLGKPYTFSFRTSRDLVPLSFGGGAHVQAVDADGRRAIQYHSHTDEGLDVTFALYPLTEEAMTGRFLAADSFFGLDPDRFATAGLPAPRRWTTPALPDGDPRGHQEETTLPSDAPPGFYVLDLVAGPVNDQLLVNVTRLALSAKVAADEALVWVTELPTLGAADQGAPLAGVAVRLLAANGADLGQGISDGGGLVRLPLDPGDPPPALLLARHGDDVAFMGFRDGDWSVGGFPPWTNWPTGTQFTGHVQTDRPLYRPGQTVNYKAIVRLEDDGRVITPPVGTQVLMRLSDARGNAIHERWLLSDAFGAVYDSVDLGPAAMLGNYALRASPVGPEGVGQSFSTTFEVQEYHKPDLTVSVTPEETAVVAGEPVTLTVRADYLYGAPVAAADVSALTFFLVDDYYGDFGYWEGSGDEPATATLRDGQAQLSVRAVERQIDPFGYDVDAGQIAWTMAVEATVDDGSGQTAVGIGKVRVFPAAEWLELTADPPRQPGTPFPVAAIVRRTVGEPDAPVAGRDLIVELRRWDEETTTYSILVEEQNWTTGEEGGAGGQLLLPETGYYRLSLSGQDEAGRAFYVHAYYGASDAAVGPTPTAVSLTADRAAYAPGDTARLLIETPFAGPGLLTVERANVRRVIPVTLTPPATAVELPILPEDPPNLFVVLTAWEAQDTTPPAEITDYRDEYSRPDAKLHYASLRLPVTPVNKQLTVTLTPEGETTAPGETAAVVVRVVDEAGAPVSAQVALAVVDEAIFELEQDRTRALYDAFYSARPHRVGSYSALAPDRWVGGEQGGGGGDDGGYPPLDARTDFLDTAAWFPALETDANGEVRVTIPLPDNLTAWRLTARAVSAETQVGEATATIRTQQPVQVRPVLPAALVAGDELTLTAIVHNDGDAAAEFTVMLSDSEGLLTIAEPVTQTLSLEAGDTTIAGWDVIAAAGETTVAVTATSAAGSDAVELPLTIRPLAVPINAFAAGDLAAGDGPVTLTLDAPADALPASTVTLEVGRSAAGSLLTGLEFLNTWPYASSEAAMSRTLANALIGQAFDTLGAEPPPGGTRQIARGLERLYALQHPGGGWGWWYDDDSSPLHTAWVVYGLAAAAEAGHEVAPRVLSNGISYLQGELAGTNVSERPFVLLSLAEAGAPDAAAALTLWQERGEQLTPFGLAALALALDAAGETEAAQAVMDALAERARTGPPGRVHWFGGRDDGTYEYRLMASDVRATGLALSAFARLRPGDPLEPQIVRWLMERRGSQGWGSTLGTAFAMLGLTDHLLAAGVTTEALPYTVTLKGAPLAARELAPGELRHVVEISLDGLRPGANTLELAAGGPLAYLLDARFLAPRATVAADGPVDITRSYVNPVTGAPLTAIRPGDLVEVRLSVQFPRDAAYVMVQDNLPGGLEALNERLNPTGHTDNYYDMWSGDWWRWREYGYNQKEIRDGAVTFFINDVRAGHRTFTYLARATQAGTFLALPAEASALYEPDSWGRSGSDELRVTRDE